MGGLNLLDADMLLIQTGALQPYQVEQAPKVIVTIRYFVMQASVKDFALWCFSMPLFARL